MKQAIAGVAPAEVEEVTSMIVWPSICATGPGRMLGRAFSWRLGFYIFRLGNVMALATIPLSLALYLYRLMPSFYGLSLYGTSYKLTNRRVVELRNEIRGVPGPNAALIVMFVLGLALTMAGVIWALNTEWSIWASILVLLGVIGMLKAALIWLLQMWPKFVYGAETRSATLDRFDSIQIDVRPGQQWFQAGDLVFLQGELETFRLPGVSRPEAFRNCCLKARSSYVGVRAARERERELALSAS